MPKPKAVIKDGHVMNVDKPNSNLEYTTVYERVGGDAFFVDLVNRFYELVEGDEILRPIYPDDLNPGKQHLASFLAQYWGGPSQYSLERGHPRLRQRHMPFPIGQAERDSWVNHMNSALMSMEIAEEDSRAMVEYFSATATMMMNR